MNELLNDFHRSIEVINDSIQMFKYFQVNAKNFDATILLRAQFILIVSAFDTFMHNILIQKIEDDYFADSDISIINFNISVKTIFSMRGKTEYEQRELLRAFLIEKFNKDSFQAPKSIECALDIIGINHIWRKIAHLMGQSGEAVRDTLSIIIKRRNQIAHESDWDKTGRQYRAISLDDVEKCKEFIEKIVLNLFKIIIPEQ